MQFNEMRLWAAKMIAMTDEFNTNQILFVLKSNIFLCKIKYFFCVKIKYFFVLKSNIFCVKIKYFLC